MNIRDINNSKCKWEDKEDYLLINSNKSKLHIYEVISVSNIRYKIKNQNNVVVAEFDNKLNMIGKIKTLVEVSEYNKVLEKLREYHQFSIEIDKEFGFDIIEAQMIKERKINRDGSINEFYIDNNRE